MTQEFEIYRDGKPDEEYLRKKRNKAVKTVLKLKTGKLLGLLATAATQALDEFDLLIQDSKYGTNLHGEYLSKRKAERVASLRQTYLA